MVQFTLFGIRVRVEPLFWLTIALLGSLGEDLQEAESLLRIALFVLAAFFSVLVHEMGHALTIRKFGYPTNVVLTTMGGYATMPRGVLSRKQSFLVSAAGPGFQILLGFIVLFGLGPFVGGQSELFVGFITDLYIVSFVWAIFNCMPIYPLDGGQMLAAAIGPRRNKALYMVGMITSGALGLLAISMGQIFLILFMGMFFYQNFQNYKQLQ